MRRFLFTGLLVALFAASALAQSSTGRLVGSVSGPDGVIPGATVTVIDNQTKRERTVTASGDGAFTVPQLEFGVYTVNITATGFKTFTATQLKIDASNDYTLNAVLEVGGVTENVTVVAGAEVVNSSNGELNSTVSPQQIQELPLDGRNPLALIPLQAGTAKASPGTVTSINGQRTSFTNITRDGINVNDNFIRSNATDFSPERASSDDTGEFSVTTQNAGANQGYGAAQVQLVTPRGANEYHGAFFIYNRNSRFAANTFPNNAAGQPRPYLNRNQFGGKMSGPLPLPRFGEGGPSILRGKGFFFGAYEKQFLRQSQTNTPIVLTSTARNGIFTFQPVNAAGAAVGSPVGVNLFSAAAGIAGAPTGINPAVASRILAGLPLPNTPGGGANTGTFSVNQGFNDDYDYYTSRLDYDINDRNTINGVYTYKKEVLLRPDVTNDAFGNVPPVTQPGINKFMALAWVMTPSSSFTNEARGGFSFPKAIFTRTTDIPAFFLTTTLINNPETTFLNQGRNQHNYNLQDNATKTFGNHSVRFGALAQIFRVNPFNDAGIVPTFALATSNNTPQLTAANFSSFLPAGTTIRSTDLTTANTLFALLGGIVGSGQQQFNPTSPTSAFSAGSLQQRYEFENYAGYVSDQWRVRPTLTLNYGLRYEIYSALRLANGIALEPIIAPGRSVQEAVLDPNGQYQVIGGNAGCEFCFFKADKDNFAPVLSFAWAPEFKNGFLSSIAPGAGRTVIRGSYRQSFVPDQFLTAARNAVGGNAGLGGTVVQATVGGTTNLNLRADQPLTDLASIPTPAALTLPRTFAQNNSAAFGNFGTVFAVDPNVQTGRIHEYSIGIQRELPWKTAFEIRYVGSHSKNLLRGIDYNQVQIMNNGFFADFQRAQANFNAFGTAFCNPGTQAGCQALTIFGNTATAPLRVGVTGGVALATFNNALVGGTPGQLAFNFLGVNADFNAARPAGSQQFPLVPNPNTGAADVLTNGAKYYYNSLQAEVRRRFSQGFSFQANYTFAKNLTDAVGTAQALFDPFLDLSSPQLEYSRADFDQTHAFNFNAIYELPIGKGKMFLNEGGVVDKIFGGFQISSILRYGSGRPITITDARGTFNRTARSARQTPNSPLSKDEIKNLFGDFTKDGIRYYFNPEFLNITTTGSGVISTPKTTVFTSVPAGQLGNLERSFINGPKQFNMDAGITKKIRFGERMLLELRGEAFNLTNRVNFLLPLQIDISSTSFGQLTAARSEQGQGLDSPRRLQFAARFEF